MKRLRDIFITFVLGYIVLVTPVMVPTTLAENQVFTDVAETHVNFVAINHLREAGIVSGTGPDTFNPDDSINRAAALKIVLKGLEIYNADRDPSGFDIFAPVGISYSDILSSEWYVPYVRFATDNTILEGYKDGTFGPEKNMNRAEALKIIVNAYTLKEKVKISVEDEPYRDVAKNAWFAEYFAFAKSKNLLLADDMGNVKPGDEITRGELSEIIYRLRMIDENKSGTFNLAMNWPVMQNAKLGIENAMPPGWEKEVRNDATILWKKDSDLKQNNYYRVYPKGAKIVMYLDKGDNQKTYFENIQRSYNGARNVMEFEQNENLLTAKNDYRYDSYRFLSNKTVIVMNLEVGESYLTHQNYVIGSGIIDSAKVTGTPTLSNEKQIQLSEIREAIHVDEEGQKILNEIADKIIIHTDTVGVGTGPIDYYHSPSLNITIKYERSFDVILDIKEGKSYKF